MPMVIQELLQHIQHARHLGEDEDSMGSSLKLPQQNIQRLQLPYRQGGGGRERNWAKGLQAASLGGWRCSRHNSPCPESTAQPSWAAPTLSVAKRSSPAAPTTVVLDEAEVWELRPHVADDAMQATGTGRELLAQGLLEDSLLEQERWGWVRGVQGDGGSLHRRHSENEPAETRKGWLLGFPEGNRNRNTQEQFGASKGNVTPSL